MYRLFLLIAVATPCFASSFSSYCTTTRGGVVIASNTYSSLMPEGMGAACPDVNFEQFQTFYNMSISAIDPDPTWDECLYGCVYYGGLGGHGFKVSFADYLDSEAGQGFVVEFGQEIVVSFPQTLTLQRPPGILSSSAELLNFGPGFLEGDEYNEMQIVRETNITFDLEYPQRIRYGVPFQVTGTVNINGLRLRLPAGVDLNPEAEFWYYYQRTINPAVLSAQPIPDTPIPEPSSFILATAALVIVAAARTRKRFAFKGA